MSMFLGSGGNLHFPLLPTSYADDSTFENCPCNIYFENICCQIKLQNVKVQSIY